MPGEERYEARRLAGLCGRCGGELDRVDKNYTYCSKCAAAKAMNTKVNKAVDEAMADAQERVTHRQMAKDMKERVMFEMLRDAVVTSTAGIDLSGYTKPAPYSSGPRNPETQVALLSDVHLGRVTTDFDRRVCESRFRYYMRKIVRIADLHRTAYPIDDLYLFILGDIIDNEVLFPTQPHEIEMSVFQQIREMTQIATEEIVGLAEHYRKVNIVAVPGNHGRVGRYHDPVTNWDNLFYLMLEATLRSHPRISTRIPARKEDWWMIQEVRGHPFLLHHGDSIRMWQNIPLYGIIQRGMRWQGSMPDDWEYMAMGHFHVIDAGMSWNEFEILLNGTLLSGDNFSLRNLGMASTPAQLTFGVNEHHGVTWRYPIWLNDLSE